MKSKKQGGFHTTSHWLVLSRGEGQKDEESALCKGIRHVHDVKTSERGCAHQTPSADHFVLSQSAARHNRITLPLLSATRHGESQTDISADSWLLLFDSIPEIPDSAQLRHRPSPASLNPMLRGEVIAWGTYLRFPPVSYQKLLLLLRYHREGVRQELKREAICRGIA